MTRRYSQPTDSSSPKDPFNYVYIVLFIHGIGTLLPWNMFITADKYFENKLTGNSTETGQPLQYKDNFLTWLGIASKFPNVTIQLINFLIGGKVRSLTNRILVSIIAQVVIFAGTTILAVADSSNWIGTFYWVTMACVVIVNVWNGVYQNCIYGSVAVLPSNYLNAVVTGMNCSGVVAAVIMILAIAVTPDINLSAVIYFAIATVFLLICFGSYVSLTRNEFFVYHGYKDERQDLQVVTNPVSLREKLSSYRAIIGQTKMQLLNIFLTYFVSLTLFPAVTATVISPSGLAGRFFSAVFCFLSFNLFSMVGNLIVDVLPKVRPNLLIFLTVSRLLFIPFFLFCNSMPKNRSVPYFFGDWSFIVGMVIMAVSNGYASSLGMMYTPQMVEKDQATSAGMLASFTVMVGIMVGIFSSIIWTNII